MLDGGVTDEGLPYLVMEHVNGLPIDRYCDEQSLSTTMRLRLFRLVCAGVEYAHRNLVVHRDLKPSNILVDNRGDPYVLDFGLAKIGGAEAEGDTLVSVPAKGPSSITFNATLRLVDS